MKTTLNDTLDFVAVDVSNLNHPTDLASLPYNLTDGIRGQHASKVVSECLRLAFDPRETMNERGPCGPGCKSRVCKVYCHVLDAFARAFISYDLQSCYERRAYVKHTC